MVDPPKIKIYRKEKYLDAIVINFTFLCLILIVIIVFLWDYYVPKKASVSLKLEYSDTNSLNNNIPSTTTQSINQNKVSSNNLQTTDKSPVETKSNSPATNYFLSGLKQICGANNNGLDINLPGSFTPQKCQPGLVCTENIIENLSVCLADIGSACNSLQDCVPEANFCLNGRCTVTDIENRINTPCQTNTDCQLGILEDVQNNHYCQKIPGQKLGLCKVNVFPFDGGCKNDNDCVSVENQNIKCVETNFSDVPMSATLFCLTGDTCSEGNNLYLKTNENFNLNYLTDSSIVFKLNIFSEGDIGEPSNQIPFTISGVSTTENRINLEPLEFYSYTNLSNNTPVKFYLGDYQNDQNNKYGICIDLLPVGSKSNYKIGGVSIPVTDTIPVKIVDDRFISSDRNTIGTIGQLCLQDATKDSIYSCGETSYLDNQWQMECGYNYNLEQLYLDNLYYGLSPGFFDVSNIGNCMIKNTFFNRLCNNHTQGCVDPAICLPFVDPVGNQSGNYCVLPFRAQICENNKCHVNYTCQDKICKSNNDYLAINNNDCVSNSATGIYIYFFNRDSNIYKKIDINLSEYFPNITSIEEDLVIKLDKEYTNVNSFSSLGFNSKTRVANRILVYSKKSLRIVILKLSSQNDKYIFDKTFSIYNKVGSIELAPDNKIAVINKNNNISGLREFAIKVSSIEEDLTFKIYPEYNENWFSFQNLQPNFNYSAYLYSSDGEYNAIGTLQYKTKIITNSNPNFEDGSFELVTLEEYFDFEPNDTNNITPFNPGEKTVFLVFNTNKFSFNNFYYSGEISKSINPLVASSYKGSFLPGTDPKSEVYFPKDYDIKFSPIDNYFFTPKVYRNTGTLVSPVWELNYTVLETGDRLKFTDNNKALVSNFKYELYDGSKNDNSYLFLDVKSIDNIDISNTDYFYLEKVNEYSYKNTSKQNVETSLYTLNLHRDFLSSEGSVPFFKDSGEGKTTFTQNFGFNLAGNNNEYDQINFTVYEDMVNYDITFIDSDTLEDNSIISNINKPEFIYVKNSSNIKVPTTNGLNFSSTYSFESETNVNFDFYKDGDNNNCFLVKSDVEGVSNYHNYIQKVKYSEQSIDDNTITANNNFTNYFISSYSVTGDSNFQASGYVFEYIDNVVVPKPKDLFYNNKVKVNTIDNVQENLYDVDSNSFSIFATYNNETFLKESGYTDSDDLFLASSNVYSNKTPPTAAYSRLSNYNIDTKDNKINIDFPGLNLDKEGQFNYVEFSTNISLEYGASGNCLNTGTEKGPNYITIRESEIIDLFLSNPSSEIVLQKDGDSLEDFYLTSGVSSLSQSIKTLNSRLSPSINIENIDYNYEGFSNPFTVNTQLNRAVVSIDEYNVTLEEEYMVLKLNAGIDKNDSYIKNIFNNKNNKWKAWYNNFVAINYYVDNDYYFTIKPETSIDNNIDISVYQNAVEDSLVILDASVLWTSCKNSDIDFSATTFSLSSFNKLVFNDGTDFNCLNIHDDYFYKIDDVFRKDSGIDTSNQVKINLIKFNPLDYSENFIESFQDFESINTAIPLPKANTNIGNSAIFNYYTDNPFLTSQISRSFGDGGSNHKVWSNKPQFNIFEGFGSTTDTNGDDLKPRLPSEVEKFVEMLTSTSSNVRGTLSQDGVQYPAAINLGLLTYNQTKTTDNSVLEFNLIDYNSTLGVYFNSNQIVAPGTGGNNFKDIILSQSDRIIQYDLPSSIGDWTFNKVGINDDSATWDSVYVSNLSDNQGIILKYPLGIVMTHKFLSSNDHGLFPYERSYKPLTRADNFRVFDYDWQTTIPELSPVQENIYITGSAPMKISLGSLWSGTYPAPDIWIDQFVNNNSKSFNLFVRPAPYGSVLPSSIKNSLGDMTIENNSTNNTILGSLPITFNQPENINQLFIAKLNDHKVYKNLQDSDEYKLNNIEEYLLTNLFYLNSSIPLSVDILSNTSSNSNLLFFFQQVSNYTVYNPYKQGGGDFKDPRNVVPFFNFYRNLNPYTKNGWNIPVSVIDPSSTEDDKSILFSTSLYNRFLPRFLQSIDNVSKIKNNTQFGFTENKEFVYFKKKYTKLSWLFNINSDKKGLTRSLSPINKTINIYGNNNSITNNKFKRPELYYSSGVEHHELAKTKYNASCNLNSFYSNNIEFKNSTEFSYGDTNIIKFTKINGYYELFVYNTATDSKEICGNIDIRPVNSGRICLTNTYINYYRNNPNTPLYLVNNLFISNIPKSINNFNYLGLKILDDYIISNIYYSYNAKKYKGFGLIKYRLTAKAAFSSNPDIKNVYNLVNYNRLRFPKDFTERYINRLQAIPIVKKIFVSINEGNIFDSIKYYVYLNYNTEVAEENNDGIILMGTNIDLESILENIGIPYTASLTEGKINTDQLSDIVTFEPYNKMLVTLGKKCGP